MYNTPFRLISLAIAATSLVGVHAQAAQNLSSMMVEIRQQDGITSYYNLATGMPLNGDIAIVRDNQGYTLGQFSQGIPNGKWQVFHSNNSRIVEGNYQLGYQEGTWRLFDLDGALTEEQQFAKGVPVGEWKEFSATGHVSQSTLYKNGQKSQVKRFFPSGKLQAQESYLDNLRHGKWESFYENGTLSQSQTYANNQLSGPYLEQNAEGQVVVNGRFDADGRRQGLWETLDRKSVV